MYQAAFDREYGQSHIAEYKSTALAAGLDTSVRLMQPALIYPPALQKICQSLTIMLLSINTNTVDGDNILSMEEELRLTAVNHPLTLGLQARNPDIKTSRSVLVIHPIDLPFSLTSTTLSGPGAILAPFVFADDTTGCVVAFYHLGSKLAGHAGIVHGGIPAMLLDECMGRACFPRLPNKVAFTAKLEVNYKAPIRVNSNIVIEAETKDTQGRKAWVEAKVRDAGDGRELIWAKALFVQPNGEPGLRRLI